ncbi:hypothetical protein [Halomonas sp. H5]|uniref:hypothetical protein n=1 Tax=Halomonas sp. H5 TaxID=3423910 RepID=UPI003D3640CF
MPPWRRRPTSRGPLLLLYGEADQVIPEAAVCTLLADLPPPPAWGLSLTVDPP